MLHILFTYCVAYIILYWIVTISNEDVTLNIPVRSAGRRRGRGQAPCNNSVPPPPRAPVSIEDLLATQYDLMRVLVQNEAHHGGDRLQHHWR
jgi:hypothetical protein